MLWWQFCTTTVLALCDTGRTKSSAGPRDAANSSVAACQFCEENLGRSVAPLPPDRPRLRPTGRPRPNYTKRVQTQSGTTSGSNKSPTGSRPVRPVRRRGWMMRGWRRRRRRRRGPAAVTTAGRRPGWRRGRRRGRRWARPGGGGDGDGGRGGGEGGGSYAISVNSCGKGVDQKSERRHSRKDLKKRASHTHSSSTRWHQPDHVDHISNGKGPSATLAGARHSPAEFWPPTVG